MLRNMIRQEKIYTIIIVNTKLFDMFMENKHLEAHMGNLK